MNEKLSRCLKSCQVIEPYLLKIIETQIRRIGRFQVEQQESCGLTKIALRDVSTQADRVSQNILIELLEEITPEYGIIAEEGKITSATLGNRIWCIDPLDGTANYASGLSLWCISLCILENYVPILALVYVPSCDDMYYAIREKGAYLNGQRLTLIDNKSLDSILFSFPIERYQASSTLHRRLDQLGEIADLVGDIRIFNATALELCYIASGKLGGLFVEETTKIWDIAGGMLILEEAGGKITTPDGNALVLCDDIRKNYSIFAASALAYKSISHIVRGNTEQ